MNMRVLAAACLAILACASQAIVTWYGGDFDGRNGAPNEIMGVLTDARTYDDFTLAGASTVSAVWSNNLFDGFTATTAAVEIRSGVGNGNGGTLLFSGTFPATVTSTGRSGLGMQERQVKVSGLSVPLGAGTYHLSVTPIGNGSGRSFASSCAGANGVGSPLANGNAFVNSSELTFNFNPAGYLGAGTWDFSLGVETGAAPLEFLPSAITPIRGVLVSGNVAAIQTSNNVRLVYRPGIVLSPSQAPIAYEVSGTAPQQNASQLRVFVESSASSGSVSQSIELFDFVANDFVLIDTRNLTTTDNLIELVVTTNPSRFIQAGTRLVRTRVQFRLTAPTLSNPWESRVDMLKWSQTP